MKIVIITGDSLRHFYLVDQLTPQLHDADITWIVQKREKENNISNNYKDMSSDLAKLYLRHFEERDLAENIFFSKNAGETSKKKINKILTISRNDFLNGELLKNFKKIRPDGLISYGCNKLDNNILDQVKLFKVNVHGGLSPNYRGTITHFWPTFLLEPEFTGMTLHTLSEKIDGGDILWQTSVNINIEDGIHENACRCVKEFSDNFPNFLKKNFSASGFPKGVPQIYSGRIWTNKMWHPITLKSIYEYYENRINKFCLENRKIKKIKLISIDS